jgi:hypothetical protein
MRISAFIGAHSVFVRNWDCSCFTYGQSESANRGSASRLRRN